MNKNSINSNFFASVARHNLERFHSECIAWAFNSSEKMLTKFIRKIGSIDDTIEIRKPIAYSEISYIDILIHYKTGDYDHFIHIENKIKANEHTIASKRQKLANEHKLIPDNTKLSQTEFYYVRDKSDIENKFTNGEKVEWKYIFLVPAIAVDKQLNTWTNEYIIENNPWLTIPYWEIIDCMPKDIENNIFNDYKTYLKEQFVKAKSNSKYQVELIGNNLSTSIINECLNEEIDTTVLETYQIKLLFGELKEHLDKHVQNVTIVNQKQQKKKSKVKFDTKFLTDTGNNGGFLFEVFTKGELKNPSPAIFTRSNKPIEFRIGFQFEQNKPGKGKFKFYFADVLYEKGLIKKSGKDLYHSAIKGANGDSGILQTIFGDKTLSQCKKDRYGEINFNKSTSKSFCSYLIDNFSFNNMDDLELKFKKEIDQLIQSFTKCCFEELLEKKMGTGGFEYEK